MKEIASLIQRLKDDIEEWIEFAEDMDIISQRALEESRSLIKEADDVLKNW